MNKNEVVAEALTAGFPYYIFEKNNRYNTELRIQNGLDSDYLDGIISLFSDETPFGPNFGHGYYYLTPEKMIIYYEVENDYFLRGETVYINRADINSNEYIIRIRIRYPRKLMWGRRA